MNAIHYLGCEYSPPRVTFAANNKRYTYDLPSPKALDTIEFLIRKVSVAKAFVHAIRVGRLSQ
jgi:hypothetical protein